MEYTLLHGNTKLQALIHKLAEWFQSQNVQLEILYGPFFFRTVKVPLSKSCVKVPIPFIYILLLFIVIILMRAKTSLFFLVGPPQFIAN